MTPGQVALLEAMRLEQARIYGTTTREARQAEHQVAVADEHERTLESTYGPAPAAVIEQITDALSPVRAVLDITTRRSIEQSIARGLGDLAIATQLHVQLLDVEHVRNEMEQLSA